VIRKALALGGDESFRINTEPVDSFFVASQIAAMARSGGYDLILTGKETIDFNGASVGGMIAGLLDLPFISLAAKLELSGNQVTLIREIEGGEETVEVNLPLVVGCQKGMAEQRIPNMKGIMARKPLK
jgi:electron transfer flavoprotein beta subunit